MKNENSENSNNEISESKDEVVIEAETVESTGNMADKTEPKKTSWVTRVVRHSEQPAQKKDIWKLSALIIGIAVGSVVGL